MLPELVEEYAPCALDAAAVSELPDRLASVPETLSSVEQDAAAASSVCAVCLHDLDETGYCDFCGGRG
jgi:hypothetical protein